MRPRPVGTVIWPPWQMPDGSWLRVVQGDKLDYPGERPFDDQRVEISTGTEHGPWIPIGMETIAYMEFFVRTNEDRRYIHDQFNGEGGAWAARLWAACGTWDGLRQALGVMDRTFKRKKAC